jgi:glycosyltransferase involved in cell wall biosynthesis
VAAFLREHSQARFLLVGKGKQEQAMEDCLSQAGVCDRLTHTGILGRDELRAAYHAMDVFAFSSKSETQGMVLTEAMAAGVPVVALRAPGVSDVVRDGVNGRMLDDEDEAAFTAALEWVAVQPPDVRQSLAEGARRTAREFSMPRCAARMLALYESLASELRRERAVQEDESVWSSAVRRVREELRIWSNVGTAVERAVLGFGTADLEEP